MENLEIMTPENNRWEEFVTRLESEEGCDFKEKIEGKPTTTWKCSSNKDRPFATAILEKMGNIDIPKSLEFFDNHGGFCDCEILFNVDR